MLQMFVFAAVQMQIWKLIYVIINLLVVFSSLVRLSNFSVLLRFFVFSLHLTGYIFCAKLHTHIRN